MLVSPMMNPNVLNGSRVKFYAKSLSGDGTLDIVTLNSNTATATYSVVTSVALTYDNGSWIGPLNFSTSCNPATTIDENFNTTSFPDLPICWTGYLGIGATPDSGITVSGGGFENSNSITIYASSSPVDANLILITPVLSNIGVPNHTLTFKAEGSNNLIVGTVNSNSSDIVFTPFQTINVGESLEDKTVDFSSYTGTDTYIGFKIVTGSTETASQYIAIDNVVWGPDLNTGSVDLVASAIYPNPVQDVLNITNSDELQSVTIYNLMGQQVLSATTNLSTIDMSHLTSGAYLVKLSSDNATKTLKVIKK